MVSLDAPVDDPLLDSGRVLQTGDIELTDFSRMPGSDADVGGDRIALAGGARQIVWRRQPEANKCYLVYCIFCCILTTLLLAITVWEGAQTRQEARFWKRKLRPWEEAAETFVGAALCTETFGPMLLMGVKRYLRDRWRIMDVVVAGLTLVCGLFFLLRRAIHHAGDIVEDIDVPILMLRFALQPLRMVSTASMVVRAHRRVRQARVEPLPPVDPRRPCGLQRLALTLETAAELREFLPAYLRFNEWKLIYSPKLHGTSLNTFYRQQEGPNILVVEDSQGGIFGGFATDMWRPQAGAYGNGEGFVFFVRNLDEDDCRKQSRSSSITSIESGDTDNGVQEQACAALQESSDIAEMVEIPLDASPKRSEAKQDLDVFWAVPLPGRIIQWSDSNMLGLGRAVSLCDDFLRGSSCACQAYDSPPLSSAGGNGGEFIVRSLECWYVGPDRD